MIKHILYDSVHYIYSDTKEKGEHDVRLCYQLIFLISICFKSNMPVGFVVGFTTRSSNL